MTPTAPLAQAIGSFVDGLVDKKRKLTQERVDSVLATGQVVIRGNVLPVTGRVPIIAGETVAVAWRDGKMDVVMMNQGRRSGGAASDVQQATGIVEELFVFEGDLGLEVWFRNADQFKPIRFVDEFGEPADSPSDLTFQGGAPIWGLGDADFFVFHGTLSGGGSELATAVYRLNRPNKNEPFSSGATVSATLVRLYNLSTEPFTFGTITTTGSDTGLTQSGAATGDLKYVSNYVGPTGAGPTDSPFSIRIRTQVDVAGVAPNADLLVVVRVEGFAAVGDSGRTGIVFDMGSIIVNVTRAEVMANHLADTVSRTVNVTPTSVFVCTPLGEATASTSNGGTSRTGVVTVLSLTGVDAQKPADPAQAGTFNNYVIVGPSTPYVEAVRVEDPPGTPIGEILCAPAPLAKTLSILGEFAAENTDFATFPGSLAQTQAQIVRYQGSRTMVLFAPYGVNGLPSGPAILRDLRRSVSSPLDGNADHIFRIGLPVPNSARPLLQVLQASLIYSPFDNRAPFNHQFFVSGHNRTTGEVQINLAALRKLTPLAVQGKLSAAKSATQILLTSAGGQSRQALDSRLNLGQRFQPGPL